MTEKRSEGRESRTLFFVMIRHQKGHPMPLTDEEEDVFLFDTRESAEDAAKLTLMGPVFGYEVYEW
jgi:hypothetical protein